ncbi:MAG: hypothetical protein RR047_02340 [Bacilli bacterium]
MGLVTPKPGYDDKDTSRYFELNRNIMEKRHFLESLDKSNKELIRKTENEINNLLMEQVLLNKNIKF